MPGLDLGAFSLDGFTFEKRAAITCKLMSESILSVSDLLIIQQVMSNYIPSIYSHIARTCSAFHSRLGSSRVCGRYLFQRGLYWSAA